MLKWLHISTAAIAFGSNVTHLFWILAANNDPVHRANILRLVKKIDDRLSVPCYAIMVICGVAMWLWQWPAAESWLIASASLTAVLSAMGISCSARLCTAGFALPATRPQMLQRWHCCSGD